MAYVQTMESHVTARLIHPVHLVTPICLYLYAASVCLYMNRCLGVCVRTVTFRSKARTSMVVGCVRPFARAPRQSTAKVKAIVRYRIVVVAVVLILQSTHTHIPVRVFSDFNSTQCLYNSAASAIKTASITVNRSL